jgi:hypothetical protein
MAEMNVVDWIAFVLLAIGGLNWGLVGLFKTDVVLSILGAGLIADIVYTLVGISALYAIGAIILKK